MLFCTIIKGKHKGERFRVKEIKGKHIKMVKCADYEFPIEYTDLNEHRNEHRK